MNAFTRPLWELKDFEDLEGDLKKGAGIRQVAGCIDSQKPHLICACGCGPEKKAAAIDAQKRQEPGTSSGIGSRYHKIVVTFSEQKARELYEDCRFFQQDAVYYPAKDILFYQSDIRGNLLTGQRLAAVKAILTQEHPMVITTFDALMDKLVPLSVIKESRKHFQVGDTLKLEAAAAQFVMLGYERNYQVEASGQFAVRGGILDIYPLTEENPVRIELWGDEIDSIRSFEADSQRSIENLEEVWIYPACEVILEEKVLKQGLQRISAEGEALSGRLRKEMKTEEAHRIKSTLEALREELLTMQRTAQAESFLPYFFSETVSLLDYFPAEETLVFLDEPARCLERGRVTREEFSESMQHRLEKGYILPGQMEALASEEEVAAYLQRRRCIALSTLDLTNNELEIKSKFYISGRTVNPYNSSFELLVKDLKQYKRTGSRVLLLSGSRTRAMRLAQDLQQEGLSSFYTEDYEHSVKAGEIMVVYGKLKRGFEYPQLQFVVISESDIFGAEKKKKKKRRVYEGEKIRDFTELKIGDYVVHENHGLGIYRGIEKVEIDNTVKDYIKIEYDKGGNLYIQATQLDLIQKYAGSDAKKPRLNRLGGQEWNKTKTRVRGAVKEIARELVELYAARQNKEGFVYGPDTVWQKEFEELFPFEETEDQVLAIEATKRDMESTKIMDRLICGDVGYGKTEIAIRAAFKAIQEGKQVVYLVPTTILAQQHYNTFAQRMKDFPVRVDLMCRFCTTAQMKKTAEDLRKGIVDIVIGTHRVLSKDVVFKDLGLLIVDEEQRFGVAHKEKIKQMKQNVDVLTLTATPIPRTLHMSLIGIRDMSVLEEPPMDRMPIQTYVTEYNEETVREAIHREMARGGQVYYVFNRVNQIEDVTAKVASLAPDANVAFAHGQMKERELEKIMYDFINGEIDVLVSTTIIETGLDISNVNTMIIHDADNLGLSQLYQLRGRVGRSNRTAYAFLMYRRNKLLKEIAEKRLAAIKEFTELGSGFKIAMRDLELRGAGNLLGAQQHGHMEAVGYDLYCKMLNEAVKTLKGETPKEQFETTIDIKMDAFIPPKYIPNEYHKLDIYKRIAGIETEEESEEMLEELIDRFGEPPKSVQNLLLIARMKSRAHQLYFTDIIQKGTDIRFALYEKARINAARIPEFVEGFYGALVFTADAKAPCFTFRMNRNSGTKTVPVQEVICTVLEKGEILLTDT